MSDFRISPRVLAGLALAAAAVLLWEMRGQTLAYDEWSFFADYRGRSISVIANPFGGNLMVVPIVLYKLVFAAFGPDSVAPRVIVTALNLTCAGLFFVLARRRVGDPIALVAAAVLVFFGVSADIVAQSLGIVILLTIACGLGMLLALERTDRRGDLIAAGLLTVALASNSHALPFAVAAAVQIGVVDPRPWRGRAWIVAAPLGAYLAARLATLHLDPLGTLASHPAGIESNAVGNLPSSLLESLGAALVSLTALFGEPQVPGSFQEAFMPALALVALAALAFRLRAAPVTRGALVFAALLLSYWLLIGVAGNDRLPTTPRYQYAGALFLMLFAAELARDIAIGARARLIITGVLALTLLSNLTTLHDRSDFTRTRSELNRAALAAIEIARDHADPEILVEPFGARVDLDSAGYYSGGTIDIDADILISADRYLSATYAFGSPAYSAAELAAASEQARAYADRALVTALAIAPGPVPPEASSCRRSRVRRGVPNPIELTLEPGAALTVAAGEPRPAEIALKRFAAEWSAALTPVPAGGEAAFTFPADRSRRPWRALISGARTACVVKL